MPVHYITGNALDFPENTNVLAHGCNRQGTMGAGIARQIAEEFPAAAEADKKAFESNENQLGMMSSAIVAGGAKRIANLYCQTHYGVGERQVDYEALYVCLQSLRNVLEDAANQGRIYRLALPWIGTGLAGGSRVVVGAMIEDIFGNSPIETFVVEYVKRAEKAAESTDKPVETTEIS